MSRRAPGTRPGRGAPLRAGHNLQYLYALCSNAQPTTINATEHAQMREMKQTRDYADRLNLKVTVPDATASTCSTQHCLRASDKVLGYLPTGGSITVLLPAAGIWNVEWFNVQAGTTVAAAAVLNGTRTLAAPFSGDAVVFLQLVTTGAAQESAGIRQRYIDARAAWLSATRDYDQAF